MNPLVRLKKYVVKKSVALALAVAVAAASLLGGCGKQENGSFQSGASSVSQAQSTSTYHSYVMGPLGKVTDWDGFAAQLAALKKNGIYGITTDIWWGYVEPQEGVFDWSYYQTYAAAVKKSGLKWVPILSMHQCGTNAGDDVYIPLPSWVWSKDTQDSMQYKDENGVWDNENISPWYSGTAELYDAVYASFAETFAEYKGTISRIELSAGPSGELRYPSYNSAAGWTYPGRGYLQSYSGAAVASLQSAMQTKYQTIAALNAAWGTSYTDFSQVQPPQQVDTFFTTGINTTYGKDFMTWYQSSLTDNLAKIAEKAHSRFDSVFGVELGAKVSGVHWLYNDPTTPHAAENCAGYYDYSTLLDQFKASDLALTFTCLEMSDEGTGGAYSMGQSLVKEISALANQKGIPLSGENALAISNNTQSYLNAAEMITKYNYVSFSLLRINNLVYSKGTVSPEMARFTKYLVNAKALKTAVASASSAVSSKSSSK